MVSHDNPVAADLVGLDFRLPDWRSRSREFEVGRSGEKIDALLRPEDPECM